MAIHFSVLNLTAYSVWICSQKSMNTFLDDYTVYPSRVTLSSYLCPPLTNMCNLSDNLYVWVFEILDNSYSLVSSFGYGLCESWLYAGAAWTSSLPVWPTGCWSDGLPNHDSLAVHFLDFRKVQNARFCFKKACCMSTDADIFINKDSHQTRGRRTVEQSKPLETQTARPRHMLNELSNRRIRGTDYDTSMAHIFFQCDVPGRANGRLGAVKNHTCIPPKRKVTHSPWLGSLEPLELLPIVLYTTVHGQRHDIITHQRSSVSSFNDHHGSLRSEIYS